MSNEKELTRDIAEKFLRDNQTVDLGVYTTITDDASESLSHFMELLDLRGLTELSDAAAVRLCQNPVGLNLKSLTGISDATAVSLSKHRGRLGLDLNGLTELSDFAAESLSKHEGKLYLTGLVKLSDFGARNLNKHKGNIFLPPRFIIKGVALPQEDFSLAAKGAFENFLEELPNILYVLAVICGLIVLIWAMMLDAPADVKGGLIGWAVGSTLSIFCTARVVQLLQRISDSLEGSSST